MSCWLLHFWALHMECFHFCGLNWRKLYYLKWKDKKRKTKNPGKDYFQRSSPEVTSDNPWWEQKNITRSKSFSNFSSSKARCCDKGFQNFSERTFFPKITRDFLELQPLQRRCRWQLFTICLFWCCTSKHSVRVCGSVIVCVCFHKITALSATTNCW